MKHIIDKWLLNKYLSWKIQLVEFEKTATLDKSSLLEWRQRREAISALERYLFSHGVGLPEII